MNHYTQVIGPTTYKIQMKKEKQQTINHFPLVHNLGITDGCFGSLNEATTADPGFRLLFSAL